MATLAGWEYLGGKTRRYRNIKTGETISRRQYDKLTSPITYEAKAKHNRFLNPEKAILRPARGRKSYVNALDWQKQEIAAQRLERQREKERKQKEQREQREIERRSQRLQKKKTRVKKVKRHLIPKGQIGWRISFNTYEELEVLIKDARATRVIFAYAIGVIGVDIRTGVLRHLWVIPYTSIKEMVSKEDFYDQTEAAIEEKAYLAPAGYFVQFAIEKDFVRNRK